MDKYYGYGMPFNASAQGGQIDTLIYVIHAFMAVLFVGWMIFLIYCLWRYRARAGHKAQYKVGHFKTPTYAETGVALFEGFLLFAFAFPMFHEYRNVVPDGADVIEIRVVAEQFAWNIHYPGKDGVFGPTAPELMSSSNPVGLNRKHPKGADDIVTINQMHVPVNRPVVVRLTSKDVIHSFAIPVMRVKHDTIPGQEIPIWFEAAETGAFEIGCAQLCGLGHYRMKGYFTVHTPEAYQAWLEEQTS